MRFTLKEIGDFCYKHKRHKGFKQHAIEQIYEHILWAYKRKTIVVVYDDNGLCGVATYTAHPEQRNIYVHHVVATRSGFASLVRTAMEMFPGYYITGLRCSKVVKFNPIKLWETAHRAFKAHLAT